MRALAIAAAIAAIGCAFGLRLLRAGPRLTFSSFLERAVFGAGVGLGIVAYLILALGVAGWLHWWAIIAVVVVLAAISWREMRQLVAGAARGLRAAWGSRASVGGAAVTAFILAMLLLAVVGALAPASQNDWDGLSYHLAAPKIYVGQHAIRFIGWLSHSNFPFVQEMLYTAGLALGGQAAAKLFHALCLALIALGLVAFGQAHWERRHGALAAAIFLSTPIAAWEATTAGNDLAAGLFALLSLYALVNWWSGRGDRWLMAAGALCGFALGVKATALALLGFCALAAFYHRAVSERSGAGAGVRAAGGLLAVAALVASPWYIKSYLWTGNPVYPFFYEWFGGKYWNTQLARAYRAEQLSFGMGRSLLAVLLAPWNLTMYGHRFFNFPERPLIFVSLGPLYLALLPGLLVLGRVERRVKFLLLYALVASGAWFVLSQHLRYAIPLLPALALCAGYVGSEVLRRGERVTRAAAAIVIAVVCVISLGIAAFVVADAAPAALGFESEPAYLTRTLDGLYTMAGVIHGLLPQDAKIIMYGETRGFYFDKPYMWGDHHHNMIAYDRMTSAQELIAAYRALGITHVLMTTQFWDAVKGRQSRLANLLADCFEQRRFVLVATRGDLHLLRIEEPRPHHAPPPQTPHPEIAP